MTSKVLYTNGINDTRADLSGSIIYLNLAPNVIPTQNGNSSYYLLSLELSATTVGNPGNYPNDEYSLTLLSELRGLSIPFANSSSSFGYQGWNCVISTASRLYSYNMIGYPNRTTISFRLTYTRVLPSSAYFAYYAGVYALIVAITFGVVGISEIYFERRHFKALNLRLDGLLKTIKGRKRKQRRRASSRQEGWGQ